MHAGAKTALYSQLRLLSIHYRLCSCWIISKKKIMFRPQDTLHYSNSPMDYRTTCEDQHCSALVVTLDRPGTALFIILVSNFDVYLKIFICSFDVHYTVQSIKCNVEHTLCILCAICAGPAALYFHIVPYCPILYHIVPYCTILYHIVCLQYT